MIKSLRLAVALLFLVVFHSLCAAQDQSDENQYLGYWSASLRSPGGPICFGLELTKSKEGELVGYLINHKERIEIPKVLVDKDGLTLDMDHYDSKITAKLTKESKDLTDLEKKRMNVEALAAGKAKTKSAFLTGEWTKRRGKDKWARMNFNASLSDPKLIPATSDVSKFVGRWSANFSESDDPAVASFTSDGKTFYGTFMTTTGDYRYLAGAGTEDRTAWLSCFDGAHAFLFAMKPEKDGTISGDFWSSNTWHETWTAVKDPRAVLPDAFKQTKLGSGKLGDFKFPNLEGVETSINDPAFVGKPRLIYVFGTWCPNCHDAAIYFSGLQKEYGDKLSILGLAFELTGDHERDADQVKKYLKRHSCDYPVLIAGVADKKLAAKSFPLLDKIRSYPTTIFVDHKGEVKAIHTGFAGPATGVAYEKQCAKFEELIDEMIDDRSDRQSPR